MRARGVDTTRKDVYLAPPVVETPKEKAKPIKAECWKNTVTVIKLCGICRVCATGWLPRLEAGISHG